MTRIWRYVLAYDGGHAPCVDDGVLTLCICKPRIRLRADVGDWVIGYMPKRQGIGRVAWAGRVSDAPTMGDYAARFMGRRDVIYRRVGWFPDGREKLLHYGGTIHKSAADQARDLHGQRALIFDPFWYWGGAAPVAPQHISDLAHYYVGESSKGSSPLATRRLQRWLTGWSAGIHGEPKDGEILCAGSRSRAGGAGARCPTTKCTTSRRRRAAC